jgi:Flp pilus assembly pilin Flp
MFSALAQRLWSDDEGALIAIEFLFIATILVIGIVVGLVNVRAAISVELTELGNAILALSQGYTVGGQLGCCGSTDGSQAIDTPGILPGPICVPPAIPSPIDVLTACN